VLLLSGANSKINKDVFVYVKTYLLLNYLNIFSLFINNFSSYPKEVKELPKIMMFNYSSKVVLVTSRNKIYKQ
jgi:hypothetical protein